MSSVDVYGRAEGFDSINFVVEIGPPGPQIDALLAARGYEQNHSVRIVEQLLLF